MGLEEARLVWEEIERRREWLHTCEIAGEETIAQMHVNAIASRRYALYDEADYWRQRADFLESRLVHHPPKGHPVVYRKDMDPR